MKTISVLVVEDNPGDLALILRMLDAADTVRFKIIPTSTLSSALEQMRRKLDIALLDLNLPDSQNLNTLRILHLARPSLPIIVLTGMADRGKAVEALANGAKDYLVKGSIDAHLLVQAILRHVRLPDSPPENSETS